MTFTFIIYNIFYYFDDDTLQHEWKKCEPRCSIIYILRKVYIHINFCKIIFFIKKLSFLVKVNFYNSLYCKIITLPITMLNL